MFSSSSRGAFCGGWDVTVPRSPPISAEIMYRRVRAGSVCQPSGKGTVSKLVVARVPSAYAPARAGQITRATHHRDRFKHCRVQGA